MTTDIVFTKDFDTATIFVMKILESDVSRAWEHFTRPEHIDLWWAPSPWKCETVNMDFREGGSWNYAMVGPEDERQNAGAKYHEINWHRSFDWTDYFTDAAGNKDENMPTVKWLFGFTGVEEGTKLTINLHFNTEEEMRMLLGMGFEEGFKMGLNQLAEVLTKATPRQ